MKVLGPPRRDSAVFAHDCSTNSGTTQGEVTRLETGRRQIDVSKIPVRWCCDSPGFGGSEINLMRVLDFALDAGHECTVLHGDEVAPEVAGFLTSKRIMIAVHSAPNSRQHCLTGFLRSRRILRQFPVGVFVVWCHHLDSNRWLQLALALQRRKYIIVEQLVPASRCEIARSRLTIPLKKFVASRATKMILNGTSQVDHYCDLVGLHGVKVLVIPNSRPIGQISMQVDGYRREREGLRKRLGLPPGPVVLCLARLAGQKDQASIIRALARCRGPGAHLPSLVLVGDGPNRAVLQTLAEQTSPGRVFFAGYQEDPLPWLAAADIFVLPSLAEGLPGALIEAMSARLPCIATDIPGNRELVRHGQTGLLVPTRAPDDLAAAMQHLLRQPALAARLADKAFELASGKYDEDAERAAWVKLLEELAS